MNIDKIIQIIRELNEEGSSIPNVSGPANVSGPEALGFSPQNFETPPVFMKKKRKRNNPPTIIARGLLPGARNRWKNK